MTIGAQVHKSNTRGHANFGWLDTWHSFSFSRYYNPDRMGFGKLRVLNDDTIAPAKGFGTHPHDNMEIISIPLEGALAHQDSTGRIEIIQKGDVQVMSAGTGITHSEYNHSQVATTKFLQIWIQPQQQDVEPRYAQQTFPEEERKNKWQLLVSPDGQADSLWINQQAFISRVDLEGGKSISYGNHEPSNGKFIFVLEGALYMDGNKLDRRDALAVPGGDAITLSTDSGTRILLIEVPMD